MRARTSRREAAPFGDSFLAWDCKHARADLPVKTRGRGPRTSSWDCGVRQGSPKIRGGEARGSRVFLTHCGERARRRTSRAPPSFLSSSPAVGRPSAGALQVHGDARRSAVAKSHTRDTGLRSFSCDRAASGAAHAPLARFGLPALFAPTARLVRRGPVGPLELHGLRRKPVLVSRAYQSPRRLKKNPSLPPPPRTHGPQHDTPNCATWAQSALIFASASSPGGGGGGGLDSGFIAGKRRTSRIEFLFVRNIVNLSIPVWKSTSASGASAILH